MRQKAEKDDGNDDSEVGGGVSKQTYDNDNHEGLDRYTSHSSCVSVLSLFCYQGMYRRFVWC